MAVVEALAVREKPFFTRPDNKHTDIQRRWKSNRRQTGRSPYLVLLTGKTPKVSSRLPVRALWQKIEALTEDLIEMEALNRVFSARLAGEEPYLWGGHGKGGITRRNRQHADVDLDPHE